MDQDTSPEEQQRYFARLRGLSFQDRARIIHTLNRSVRRAALLGVQSRHAGCDSREAELRVIVRLYGRETAERFFGPLPDDAR